MLPKLLTPDSHCRCVPTAAGKPLGNTHGSGYPEAVICERSLLAESVSLAPCPVADISLAGQDDRP